MTAVRPRMLVDGVEIPIMEFDVTGGAYGSTGSCVASSSIKALENAKFDLVARSIASPGSMPVDVYATVDGTDHHLFSGEYLTGRYAYKRSVVSFHARDWAGPLVDQKRVLTSLVGGSQAALAPQETDSPGISTQNQKLSKIVTAAATQFSLIPDLRLSKGSDADVGAVFGNTTDSILTTAPQSLWAILNTLAKQSGNVVYVTPEKHLVFGEPGAGLETLALSWQQNQLAPGAIPLLDLTIEHNPRRNLTFRVMVLSYDPTNQQMTKGEAYVVGTNYKAETGSTIHAGSWGGADAQAITKAIGVGRKSKKKAIPIYTYHADGLTAAQAQARAVAIAADISKRELVGTLESDVIPGISPSQPATLTGLIAPEFASHTYYVTAYSHRFRQGKEDAEFGTYFSLLDRQPAGTGKSTSDPLEA